MSNPEIPTKYADAAKVAEQITLAELGELLDGDDNPYVFPGPRKRRQIAMGATLATQHWSEGRGFVHFDRCSFGEGYTTSGGTSVGFRFDRPVFVFDRHGVRIVQVEASS